MKIFLILLLFPFIATAQQFTIMPLTTGTNTSIRGLAVVDDRVAWVSGSNGHIGRTTDGGKSWAWTKPQGFDSLDFRDIEAFDASRAVIVNAGSPAFVLLTDDGGTNWRQSYVNRDSAIFLDGMDFWDATHGMIFGDPIKGKLQLLRTKSGGASWEDISAKLKYKMEMGEAGFAASGSTIKTMDNGKVWIANYVECGNGGIQNFSDCTNYTWTGTNEINYVTASKMNDSNTIWIFVAELGLVKMVKNNLSTIDFTSDDTALAYPNPVQNTLNVSFDQMIDQVSIYNVTGQQVLTKAVGANQGTVDVSGLAAGNYIVKMTSANAVKTLKVIKQ